MAQNNVFHQIIKYIPRTRFQEWVHEFQGDKRTRTLNCWTWFGSLLFGQLTGHDSIRAIERLFSCGNKQMKQLGFGEVKKSTLAEANTARPLGVLEKTYEYCLQLAHQCGPKNTRFRFNGKIFILDSTTIELCLNLSPWAVFHHNRGAAKLHTAIDLAGNLPDFAVVTHGRVHDSKVAKRIKLFKKGDTTVFDKAYIDYAWLNELNQKGVYFVTRSKSNCQFKVLESRPTNRTRGHICDQVIYLKSNSGQRYEGKLRRITYRDPDTDKRLTFLTNRFDLATQTICDLYKARWQVELFYKTLKQNLKIKKFLGTTARAVKAQIYVALIAYLLVQIIRWISKSIISMPDCMAVIGVLLLMKEPLKRILGDLPATTRYPPDPQLVLNL